MTIIFKVQERERWKKITEIVQNGNTYIPKFETYISNYGRVKRTYLGKNIPDLIYKKELDKSGYVQVSLMCIDANGNSVRKYVKVHRLVAQYFVDNPNSKKFNIVNHLSDENGEIHVDNNYYKLLEWTDLSGNQKYAVKQNRANFGNGENNISHKLKENDIRTIIKLIYDGYNNSEISKIYGVDSETIRNIRIGKSWKNITQKNQAPII